MTHVAYISRRVIILVVIGLDCARAVYTWAAATQECARVSAESNIWTDPSNMRRANFDLHIMFPLGADADFMEKTVRVEFMSPLTIRRVEPQGAANAVAGGSNFVEVQVTPGYIGHEYFSIQGFREGGTTEDLRSPTITCNGGADVPPPSPPHLPDCDLAPEYSGYPLGGTREAGSDVTIKLSTWKPFRVFTVVYFGVDGLLVDKPQGASILHNPQRVGDRMIGFTFSLDPQGSEGLRCEGHPACVEFEVKPAPHHKPHIVCIESPPPHPPWPPPRPPPPVPGHPPSASPPPPVASPVVSPPPTSISAPDACPLDATARIVDAHFDGGKTVVRIAVTVRDWEEGATITLGLNGDGLLVTRAVHASPASGGALLPEAARSFSFTLTDEPIEMPAFAVVLDAQRWGSLVSLACSRKPPPKQPAPRVIGAGAASASYGDDGNVSPPTDGAVLGSSYGEDLVGKPVTTVASQPSKMTASAQGSQSSGEGGGSLVTALVVFLLTGVAASGAVVWARRQGKLAFQGNLRGALEQMRRNQVKCTKDEKAGIVAAAAAETEGLPPARSGSARPAPAACPSIYSVTMDDDDEMEDYSVTRSARTFI